MHSSLAVHKDGDGHEILRKSSQTRVQSEFVLAGIRHSRIISCSRQCDNNGMLVHVPHKQITIQVYQVREFEFLLVDPIAQPQSDYRASLA